MDGDHEQFQMKGFLHAESLFSSEETAAMRDNVERYLLKVAPKVPQLDAIPIEQSRLKTENTRFVFLSRMELYDDFFGNLRLDPRLSELAQELLGCEVEVQHVQFLDIVPDVCRSTPPHQDAPIFSIDPNHALTFWIPLSETDEQRGCLHYVPGSHWQGYLSHDETGPLQLTNENSCRDIAAAMPAQPGDVLAHHCFTIHYSSENRSGESRWALAVHFYPVGTQHLNKQEWLARQTN